MKHSIPRPQPTKVHRSLYLRNDMCVGIRSLLLLVCLAGSDYGSVVLRVCSVLVLSHVSSIVLLIGSYGCCTMFHLFPVIIYGLVLVSRVAACASWMLVWSVLYRALCIVTRHSQRIVARWACGHLHRMYSSTPVRSIKCVLLCWFTELEVFLWVPIVTLLVHNGWDIGWTFMILGLLHAYLHMWLLECVSGIDGFVRVGLQHNHYWHWYRDPVSTQSWLERTVWP